MLSRYSHQAASEKDYQTFGPILEQNAWFVTDVSERDTVCEATSMDLPANQQLEFSIDTLRAS